VETLLIVFVGLTALAFLLQSIAMWRAFGAVRETAERLNAQSEGIQRDIQEISAKLKVTAESLQPLGKAADEISVTLRDVATMVRTRTVDLDQFLQEMIQTGREQALKVDYVVTDTVAKFEETTEIIKRDVIRPVIEISSFIKGLRSGVAYLFGKRSERRRPPDEFDEDFQF
jgi:methyl-accepting chemotaxis protein